MNKKYKLTDETMEMYGKTLHRIQAVRNFGDVQKGDLGGWVEGKNNLSHDGTCWIYDDAVVRNNAYVSGDSKITGNAIIQDYAKVMDSAIIYENAIIGDCAFIMDDAQIRHHVQVGGKAEISDDAIVEGYTKIGGDTIIEKNAYITSNRDFFCIDYIGSKDDTVTFYVDKNRNIYANTGCFNDTLEALEQAVAETHGNNKYAQQYYHAIQLAKLKLE